MNKKSLSEKRSVVLFFIDGLGIGPKNENNPLAKSESLQPLAHFTDEHADIHADGELIATDACLGIDGRPQSASGQTTIYTGINAPAQTGAHKQGFPNAKLREIIKEHSIFRQLQQKGIGPNIFANVYTPPFFEKEPRWKSATTCAVEAAGMTFCRLPDLLGRRGIYHDFTNDHLIQQGYDVPRFGPDDAAEILAALTRRHRFTLYEHFITDKIGHMQDFEWAARHLPPLALFVRETLKRIDLKKTTFILTSDHGNIEDLSKRNHTLNQVPTIIWGREKVATAGRIRDLTDITPAIIDLLSG